MLGSKIPRQLLVALLLCAFLDPVFIRGQGSQADLPTTETLSYTIEWRLITAGTAKVHLMPRAASKGSELRVKLDSAGLVSKLYKIDDLYDAQLDPGLCATALHFEAQEGRRKRDTRVTYDRAKNKADYIERDLIKNSTVKKDQIDIPNCVHDVAGALLAMRRAHVDVGKSFELPVSDGKKVAMVRVESQEREQLQIHDKPVKTVRYEAFLFNGTIFVRKARLLVWLTDDAQKIPVQIRVQMSFPVGTITLTLDKEERS